MIDKKEDQLKKEDRLMRQLFEIACDVAGAFVEIKESTYQISEASGESNLLKTKLMELLEDSKINEAENLLFEAVDANNMNHFLIASDFYYELSQYDDDYLNQCNFSRIEIDEGLLEIQNLFNLNTI